MTEVRNDKQVENMLRKLAEEALDATAVEVLDIFLKKYIWKFAYIKNPKMYQRTKEFADAWEFKDLRVSAKVIAKELWYNPDKVPTFAPKRFIHGSKYSSPTDIRKNLPAILEGKQSSLWISVNRKNKFWQVFISDMTSRGELHRIIFKNFSAKGFKRA